ncbi:MAG: molybdopterin dinucleotide binding domain-containing protein [Ilumatobacteraceae bacterium]
MRDALPQRLVDVLEEIGPMTVAYSGGVDSTLLAIAATAVLGGARSPAITAVSPSLAADDFDRCTRLAREHGLNWHTVDTDEMADERYRVNDTDRCYWCKTHLMEALEPVAVGTIVLGVNVDDLATTAGQRMGQPRVPTFVPPTEGPQGPNADRFPLQLMTPKHHARFLNSGYSHLPKHGPAEGGPFVELDAADAERRGLGDGDVARVFNDRASLELPVKITERLRPGLASIPWGWWRDHHPDGKVANSLTNDTLTEWGGGVAYSDTLVQIEPA